MEDYNYYEIEAEIEKIEDELEQLIIIEICKEFSLNKRAYSLSLVDLNIQYFGLGFCHAVWDIKKRLLKEKYDINWKSPSDLNPEINFD